MCLNPILIKNVNYGNKSKLAHISDTTAQYIPVPCGRCSVCLALKQQYIVQRVQMESLSHDLYFGTLTYNNEALPNVSSGEFNLPYVDISDWQKMLKMIRKHENLPPFRYLMVTEYGGKRHRPHIHFILSFPKDESQRLADRRSFEIHLFNIFLKYWRRNIAEPVWSNKRGKFMPNYRNPKWLPLCTFKRTLKSYNYDLHYLDPNSSSQGLDDVAFYVSKYCLKYDKWVDKLKSKLYYNLPESEYIRVWDLLRPRRLLSKGFGSPDDPKVISHIRKGINLALGDFRALFPYFISPVNGSTFPLCPYYSDSFLTLSDLSVFNSRKPTLTDNDMMLDSTPKLSPDEAAIKQNKFDFVSDFLNSRHTYFDDDFNLNYLDPYGIPDKVASMGQDFADCWQNFDDSFDSDT